MATISPGFGERMGMVGAGKARPHTAPRWETGDWMTAGEQTPRLGCRRWLQVSAFWWLASGSSSCGCHWPATWTALEVCGGRGPLRGIKAVARSIDTTSAVVRRATVLWMSADGGVNGFCGMGTMRAAAAWGMFISSVACSHCDTSGWVADTVCIHAWLVASHPC
jgi:hypothetical protein